ncbi:MAG TPA: hypothetical protein DCZ10_13010 [Pelotomaculum sp.]|nr:hypothetical protein [Pelotomaculum sp.]
MNKKLNILQLYDYMKIGGAETHMLSLSRAMQESGHSVWVGASYGPAVNWVKEYGLGFIDLALNNVNSQINCLIDLIKIIRKKNIDIIHIHPGNSQIIGAIAGLVTEKPVVTTIHGNYKTPVLEESIKPLIDKIICVSEEVKKSQLEFGVKESSIKVIPNSVYIKSLPNKNDFFKDNVVQMVYISRLDKDKISSLMKLLVSIPVINEHYEVRLTIIGGGTQYTYIKDLAEIINTTLCKEIITLTGETTDTEEYIHKSDIVLGVGRVVLEGLASGKFTFCIGNHYYTGLITNKNLRTISKVNFTDRNTNKDFSVRSLLEDILHVFNNFAQAYNELVDTCNAVDKYFSIKKAAHEHLECYSEVIENFKCKTFSWHKWSSAYSLSKEMNSLLSSNAVNVPRLEYILDSIKKVKILLSPDFESIDDHWRKALKRLVYTLNNTDPVSVVIRIENKFHNSLNNIVLEIDDYISGISNNNKPDIIVDLCEQYEKDRTAFLSKIDYFIPTNNNQVLMEIILKLQGKTILPENKISRGIFILPRHGSHNQATKGTVSVAGEAALRMIQ